MTMLSATVRSGISDSSWKTQAMPALGGLRRRGEGHLAALEQHAAFVGGDDARHDLDQRRLAGAVLAEYGVDASGARPSSSAFFKRTHAAIALRDAFHAEKRSGTRIPSRVLRMNDGDDGAAALAPPASTATYWFSFGLSHDFLGGEIDAAGREGIADEEVVGLVGIVILVRP